MGFSRQEYWSGSPFPSPGGLPDSGVELTSALAGALLTTEPPGKPETRFHSLVPLHDEKVNKG